MKTIIPYKIEVVPYDMHWPNLFKDEANRIQKILGADLKEIYHIGSTSMPAMPAKPVIDILLVVENTDDIDVISEKLTQINYEPVRRQIIPHVSFFTKRSDQTTRFHLHLHERGSLQVNRHIHFRDYVIHHPKVADDYAKLKIKLATQFADDIYAYVSGKDKLVQEIDTKAKLWLDRKRNYLLPNTGALAKDWPHEKLVKAMEANLNVHMTHFAQYLSQVELIRVPGFTLVNSSLPDDTFNYAIDADFSSADANKKISEVTDYFTQKNSSFSWWISPHDQPADLSAHLETHGYKNTENNCAMYFDLDVWDGQVFSIPKLNIVRATDEKTLHDFALVLANDEAAFKTYFSWIASILRDDDPIEYYVGYVDGKPVVRGLSCYFAQVTGLYWLSTAPSERKKGYGRAMQEHRLKRAKELGYHVAVLQASNEGYPLYRKLGYKECGHFREYKKVLSMFDDVNLENIQFKVIQQDSNDALAAALLRERIYHQLFGSDFIESSLDQHHIQIIGLTGEEVISTAVLVPEESHYKMQRVVVKEALMNHGIGSKMMAFCETYAKKQGMKSIYCHARDAAVKFYLKNNYTPEGDYFTEDTMPHLKMRKLL